jgi:excisionase family DNA binding protein
MEMEWMGKMNIAHLQLGDHNLDPMRMLKYAEAAELLKVDKRTIRRRVAAGRYIAYGDGSGKRLLYSSILADIERNSGEVN